MYSIPILREEKCTKDSHVLLPSHTTTIQHCPYLYYYHPLFITYYSNILSNPVFVHQIFRASCTKYKFIVAVISPFFIWMAIFERSLKKVVCPWPHHELNARFDISSIRNIGLSSNVFHVVTWEKWCNWFRLCSSNFPFLISIVFELFNELWFRTIWIFQIKSKESQW